MLQPRKREMRVWNKQKQLVKGRTFLASLGFDLPPTWGSGGKLPVDFFFRIFTGNLGKSRLTGCCVLMTEGGQLLHYSALLLLSEQLPMSYTFHQWKLKQMAKD